MRDVGRRGREVVESRDPVWRRRLGRAHSGWRDETVEPAATSPSSQLGVERGVLAISADRRHGLLACSTPLPQGGDIVFVSAAAARSACGGPNRKARGMTVIGRRAAPPNATLCAHWAPTRRSISEGPLVKSLAAAAPMASTFISTWRRRSSRCGAGRRPRDARFAFADDRWHNSGQPPHFAICASSPCASAAGLSTPIT